MNLPLEKQPIEVQHAIYDSMLQLIEVPKNQEKGDLDSVVTALYMQSSVIFNSPVEDVLFKKYSVFLSKSADLLAYMNQPAQEADETELRRRIKQVKKHYLAFAELILSETGAEIPDDVIRDFTKHMEEPNGPLDSMEEE